MVNIDIMTYAANNDNLIDIGKKDIYNFIQEDICNYEEIVNICKRAQIRLSLDTAC